MSRHAGASFGACAASLLANPGSLLWPDIPMWPYGPGLQDLAVYMETMLKWNKSLNLTGCHDNSRLLASLIQDSFHLAAALQRLTADTSCPQIWDLGAGAGLPGIPLRTVWPKGHYTWVERNQKRAIFLQNICARLKLANVSGFTGDASDFLAQQKDVERTPFIISRAFMPWPQLLELCEHALDSGGFLVIMANDAPPRLPRPWILTKSSQYSVGLNSRPRWLWELATQLSSL